jgi:hypothetical protein
MGGRGGGRGGPLAAATEKFRGPAVPGTFYILCFFIILEKHPFNIKMLIEYFTHQEYIIDLIT